jgi:hypothetical protein
VDRALIGALIPAHEVVTTRDTDPVDPKAITADELTLICGAIAVVIERVTALRGGLTWLRVTDELSTEAVAAILSFTRAFACADRTELVCTLGFLVGVAVTVVIDVVTELLNRLALHRVTDDLARLAVTDERAIAEAAALTDAAALTNAGDLLIDAPITVIINRVTALGARLARLL